MSGTDNLFFQVPTQDQGSILRTNSLYSFFAVVHKSYNLKVNFECTDLYNDMSVQETIYQKDFRQLPNHTNDNLFKLAAFFEIKRLLQQDGEMEIERWKRIMDLAVNYQVLVPDVTAFAGLLKSTQGTAD